MFTCSPFTSWLFTHHMKTVSHPILRLPVKSLVIVVVSLKFRSITPSLVSLTLLWVTRQFLGIVLLSYPYTSCEEKTCFRILITHSCSLLPVIPLSQELDLLFPISYWMDVSVTPYLLMSRSAFVFSLCDTSLPHYVWSLIKDSATWGTVDHSMSHKRKIQYRPFNHTQAAVSEKACATTGCQNWTPEVDSESCEEKTEMDGSVGRRHHSQRHVFERCSDFAYSLSLLRHYFLDRKSMKSIIVGLWEKRKNDGTVEVEDEKAATNTDAKTKRWAEELD